MSQPIQRADSFSDAILLAAERASVESRKYMVLVKDTDDDIFYAAHPLNVPVPSGESLDGWDMKFIIEAKN